MGPHINEGPLPFNYGSVDDSEQPTRHSSVLPRSSRCSYPAVVEQRLPQQKNILRDPETGSGVSRRLVATVLFGLAFVAWGGVSLSRSTASRNTAAASGFFEVGVDANVPAAAEVGLIHGPSSAAASALEFTALNFYHVRDGKPGQDYPWLKNVKLIEPHRDTTLAVVAPREGFVYRWEIRSQGGNKNSSGEGGRVGAVQATATGAVAIVVLTQLDEHLVVLEEVDGDGQVANRLEEAVLVKYVRREIRTLTDDEREELLDAVSVAQQRSAHRLVRQTLCMRHISRSALTSNLSFGILIVTTDFVDEAPNSIDYFKVMIEKKMAVELNPWEESFRPSASICSRTYTLASLWQGCPRPDTRYE